MSCTAKIPIYIYFCAIFFPHHQGAVMCSLYLLSVFVGLLVAMLGKGSLFRGEAVPFVMELPSYRLPGVRNTLMLMWEKARDFLRRAFTVIFLASIVIWFLQNFSWRLSMVADTSDSILSQVAGLLAPLFSPLGLGDWRWVTALTTGFLAKETVVSTIDVLFPDPAMITSLITQSTAYVLMVFCLLYTPCIAAIASVRRELGNRWAVIVVAFQCVVAWVVAFIVKLLLMILL